MTSKDAIDKGTCPFCHDLSDVRPTKPLLTSVDILVYLDHFRDKRQEYFVCLSLDSGQRLIARRVVTVGLLDTALAHPREIFSGPLTDRAASVVIAHNHPSGDPTPSKQDINTTQQVVAAGQILGVPLRDHIIIAGEYHYSFRRHGFI